ncbi:MAG: hypothetical protein AAGF95_22510 [Chloroflexota bacterium]
MGSKYTKQDLQTLTDYVEFESFCHNLMSCEGYKNIEPLGGVRDKGRDAIHIGKSNGEITIFIYSVEKTWKRKLHEDAEKIYDHNHSCNQIVFLTQSYVTSTLRDQVKENIFEEFGWELDIYDVERIATLVDNHYQHLIHLHPSIFVISIQIQDNLDSVNSDIVTAKFIREWRDFESFLLSKQSQIPLTQFVSKMDGEWTRKGKFIWILIALENSRVIYTHQKKLAEDYFEKFQGVTSAENTNIKLTIEDVFAIKELNNLIQGYWDQYRMRLQEPPQNLDNQHHVIPDDSHRDSFDEQNKLWYFHALAWTHRFVRSR